MGRGSDYFPWCACCKAQRICESGTKAVTPKKDPAGARIGWQIASGTKLQANHKEERPQLAREKLCDYLTKRKHGRESVLMAVELKSNVYNVSGIVAQLQNGAYLLEGEPARAFRALLVKSGGIKHPMTRRLLANAAIFFHGKRHPIIICPNNVDLSEVE